MNKNLLCAFIGIIGLVIGIQITHVSEPLCYYTSNR